MINSVQTLGLFMISNEQEIKMSMMNPVSILCRSRLFMNCISPPIVFVYIREVVRVWEEVRMGRFWCGGNWMRPSFWSKLNDSPSECKNTSLSFRVSVNFSADNSCLESSRCKADLATFRILSKFPDLRTLPGKTAEARPLPYAKKRTLLSPSVTLDYSNIFNRI